jgi:hypothetical protein
MDDGGFTVDRELWTLPLFSHKKLKLSSMIQNLVNLHRLKI